MVLNPAVRDYYENNPLMVSSPFGGVNSINERLVRDVFGRLRIEVEGKRILDAGCGRGYIGEIVHADGGAYTGADIVHSRPGFPFAKAEAARLPFKSGSFDGVFCIDAFEHIPDADEAARDFHRVLRPGGFVFLSVPNYSNMAGLVKFWCERWGGYEPLTWAPFRRWQPQEYERALTGAVVARTFKGAGFVRMTRIGYGADVGLGLFPWIAHPKMPEWALYRLQRLFGAVGPAVAAVCPWASLHQFWKIEK